MQLEIIVEPNGLSITANFNLLSEAIFYAISKLLMIVEVL